MLPAYAGMILAPATSAASRGRAPRVCGDDPPPMPSGSPETSVLPAYAGMIPPSRRAEGQAVSAPRVCGDDPGAHGLL